MPDNHLEEPLVVHHGSFVVQGREDIRTGRAAIENRRTGLQMEADVVVVDPGETEARGKGRIGHQQG